MATTTTRKRTTTTKSKTEPVKETRSSLVEAPKNEEPKEKKVFAQDEGIPCRSITQGGLYMEGAKTKMLYEWSDYGDITYVEYADLASAVRVRSQYIFAPFFMNTENYSVGDLEVILTYPVDRMMEEIKALPKSTIESLKVLAASSINNGDLDSVSKIKALDEFFGTKLSILAEFK